MTYTYEVQQNIGTSGHSTINTKYIAFIRNGEGHIVKTMYGFMAASLDRAARAMCADLERKGGTWTERRLAEGAERWEARAAKKEEKDAEWLAKKAAKKVRPLGLGSVVMRVGVGGRVVGVLVLVSGVLGRDRHCHEVRG